MVVVPGDLTLYVDIDDTLISWSASPAELINHGIRIEVYEQADVFLPHKKHIEELKKHKSRGHTVVVWTKGGCKWGQAVVKALGLEDYVDLVVSKPMWCIDDQDPSQFMPKPKWLKDE